MSRSDPGCPENNNIYFRFDRFPGKRGRHSYLLIRFSHNDVRNVKIFLEQSIFKRHDIRKRAKVNLVLIITDTKCVLKTIMFFIFLSDRGH